MKVIDASGMICGRLATKIVKMIMGGENVYVVNVEKAVISGHPDSIVRSYREKIARGDIYKGPFHSRVPDRIFKRMVRGMVSYKISSGREALRRLHVYAGTPKELSSKITETVSKNVSELRSKHITLHDLSKKLGK